MARWTLGTLLSRYETALREHDIALPYVRIAGGPDTAGGSGGTGGEGGAGDGGGARAVRVGPRVREATGP
ncbi:hypothetical protein U5640_26095 [Streptomyces sp. SS7]|uniref:hypothetical protein n=1 Tax=Streptomyces sp. SS7 TaxID=3108485 RepID=UPI0030EC853F